MLAEQLSHWEASRCFPFSLQNEKTIPTLAMSLRFAIIPGFGSNITLGKNDSSRGAPRCPECPMFRRDSQDLRGSISGSIGLR
jgi:hypothetical protein